MMAYRTKWRVWVLLVMGIFCVMSANGQSAYTGGTGDGYARHGFVFLRGDPPPETGPTVLVAGNPVREGVSPTIYVEGIRTKLVWVLYDAQGKELKSRRIWTNGNRVIELDVSDLSVGIYLLDVQIDGHGHRKKIVVADRP
ncbi:MAG: T9SS type A sorting domain-containing protein [Bacteroidota bacterium]